jgi:hypothetical protein
MGNDTVSEPAPPRTRSSLSPSEVFHNQPGNITVPTISRVPKVQKPAISFITRAELAEVQRDIQRIVTPSWFTKVQPTFGELSNGKMKAAEWRSLFSAYLPMTFLRLWGQTEERRLHLKGLLLLSAIVNTACSTHISPATIQFMDRTTRLYLEVISTLGEGNMALVINHHLSLHLSSFMQLHGPSRTHWAFPFERLIGKLQRLQRNSNIGE